MAAARTTEPFRPIWLRLYQAIDAHVDAGDREDFLDTVVTVANRRDATEGNGAGDSYIAQVINSLTGTPEDNPGD